VYPPKDYRLIVFNGLGFLVLAAGCCMIGLTSDMLTSASLHTILSANNNWTTEYDKMFNIILAPVCFAMTVGKLPGMRL